MRPGGYFFEDAALYAGDKAQNGTMIEIGFLDPKRPKS